MASHLTIAYFPLPLSSNYLIIVCLYCKEPKLAYAGQIQRKEPIEYRKNVKLVKSASFSLVNNVGLRLSIRKPFVTPWQVGSVALGLAAGIVGFDWAFELRPRLAIYFTRKSLALLPPITKDYLQDYASHSVLHAESVPIQKERKKPFSQVDGLLARLSMVMATIFTGISSTTAITTNSTETTSTSPTTIKNSGKVSVALNGGFEAIERSICLAVSDPAHPSALPLLQSSLLLLSTLASDPAVVGIVAESIGREELRTISRHPKASGAGGRVVSRLLHSGCPMNDEEASKVHN